MSPVMSEYVLSDAISAEMLLEHGMGLNNVFSQVILPDNTFLQSTQP